VSSPIDRVENPFGRGGPGAAEVARRISPSGSTRSPLPELRELSGWEEEFVEGWRGGENTARLVNEILARCLVAPGIDPGPEARARVDGLLVAERDMALLYLRQISLGDEVELVVDCPECGRSSDVRFPLSSVPLDIRQPPRRLTLELDDGVQVKLRMPTAGDQAELLDVEAGSAAERRSALLGRVIVAWGDREDGFDADFARSLPVGTRRKLEAALDKVVPVLDLDMQMTCPSCSARSVAPFDVASFFLTSSEGAPAVSSVRPSRSPEPSTSESGRSSR